MRLKRLIPVSSGVLGKDFLDKKQREKLPERVQRSDKCWLFDWFQLDLWSVTNSL